MTFPSKRFATHQLLPPAIRPVIRADLPLPPDRAPGFLCVSAWRHTLPVNTEIPLLTIPLQTTTPLRLVPGLRPIPAKPESNFDYPVITGQIVESYMLPASGVIPEMNLDKDICFLSSTRSTGRDGPTTPLFHICRRTEPITAHTLHCPQKPASYGLQHDSSQPDPKSPDRRGLRAYIQIPYSVVDDWEPEPPYKLLESSLSKPDSQAIREKTTDIDGQAMVPVPGPDKTPTKKPRTSGITATSQVTMPSVSSRPTRASRPTTVRLTNGVNSALLRSPSLPWR